jgi:ATP-dependent RNA helicase DeaD
LKSFDELKLSEPLARAVKDLGFSTPTPIQAQALPLLLEGACDFIGLAATGTGKTLAFGIPLLEGIDAQSPHVQAIVLCPTRELALQVSGQLTILGKHKGVRVLPVYGGTGYEEQFRGLERRPHVIVGTPGRLIDHLERGSVQLGKTTVVCLDEADEMISMGFKEELEEILKGVPREKARFWLFSATMSPAVRKVADTYLRKPKQAQVNRTEMLSSTVEQGYYIVREGDKPEVLCKLLDLADDFYGLVFCQTKALVMDLTSFLNTKGYKVDSLHGDKSQDERERAMKAFRDRKVKLLVCTDVASRGLDVKDLTHVINYSIPKETELYVHRIGRTARGGKSGIALSLVSPAFRPLINRLEYLTKTKLKELKVPGRREVAEKKISRLLKSFNEQKHFEKAVELLGEDWAQAAGDMTLGEVIGRFITMIMPELFDERPPEKPLVAPTPTRPPYKSTPYKGKNYQGNKPGSYQGSGKPYAGSKPHAPGHERPSYHQLPKKKRGP